MTLTIADVTPRQALERFHDELGLTDTDLSAAFAVSARTLTRWRKGEAYPQHEARDKMNLLLALADTLSDTFDTTSASHTWMHSESTYLGGLTPTEAVRAGRVDRAILALRAMEAGVYLQGGKIIHRDWSAEAALAGCPVSTCSISVWRIHKQRYEATDATGSLYVSGRYHRGLDDHSPAESFPVLYTSLSPETCLAELVRHTVADTLPYLNGYRLTEIEVTLHSVVDCTDPERLGMTIEDLTGSASVEITHAIGEAADSGGYEAIRVPSASLLGNNLIIFTRNLRSESSLTVVRSQDPRLRIDPDG